MNSPCFLKYYYCQVPCENRKKKTKQCREAKPKQEKEMRNENKATYLQYESIYSKLNPRLILITRLGFSLLTMNWP